MSRHASLSSHASNVSRDESSVDEPVPSQNLVSNALPNTTAPMLGKRKLYVARLPREPNGLRQVLVDGK
jgi:hypothetical protein